MSNLLRIEDENSVLGFIFHYTQNLGEVYSDPKAVAMMTSLLVQALRYNFLCLRRILSALRRNEWLRSSSAFIESLKTELGYRVSEPES